MINIDDFIKRIETILEYYGLSASSFADALGVQRSGLSHLMSGRNKPSLDFIMKISDTYPDVNLYWLLNGTGNFPPKDSTEAPAVDDEILSPQDSIPTPAFLQQPFNTEPKPEEPLDLFSAAEPKKDITPEADAKPINEIKGETKPDVPLPIKTENSTAIAQIVIFYKDGTFKSFDPAGQ